MRLSNLLPTAKTIWRVGPINTIRVALYRAGLKTGLHPVLRLAAPPPQGEFFTAPSRHVDDVLAPENWREDACLFGWLRLPLSPSAPSWFTNVLNGREALGQDQQWWLISDFSDATGDIKGVWELSRMDWLVAMAQRAAAGEVAELARLNHWLNDWSAANPPYYGPNWKCGQEAAIRVLHMAVASLVLGTDANCTEPLRAQLQVHLARIAPTISYAVAQDNNHATSEAAALFIGGTWLAQSGNRQGASWARLGRAQLEARVARLVSPDGSFSQHSVNYHRLMLETITLAEVWRQRRSLPAFSARLGARATAAWKWLAAVTDPQSGDAPNLGANDGAHLLQLTSATYRDFRPAVQLAAAAFDQTRVFGHAGADDALRWLGIIPGSRSAPAHRSELFDNGGYAVLRAGHAMALMRFPRFRFRPSHADSLHVDLWVNGQNHLRDGGTYSYNDGTAWIDYFTGVRSHNVVEFDDDEPMRRLGRFLFADWPRTHWRSGLVEDEETVRFSARFADYKGRIHSRTMTLGQDMLRVEDQVSGFARNATLRWRLYPSEWRVESGVVTDGFNRLEVTAAQPIIDLRLAGGHESRCYGKITQSPVVEVDVAEPGVITTRFGWQR